jgi:hypothetical protein
MTNETSTPNAGNTKPVAYLYYAKESSRRGGKDRLVRIGAVFAHKTGNGRTHVIDVLPVNLSDWNGRLVEFEATDDAETAPEATA